MPQPTPQPKKPSQGSGSLMIQRNLDVQVIEFLESNVLDQVRIDMIHRELSDLVETCGVPKLVVSFENVKHISSAMIGVIMSLNKKVKEYKGEIRLACISPSIQEVFKITRLDKLLKIYRTTDEALAKF